MAVIEVEITDENKVEFIKQLLKEYGLSEVALNTFADKKNIDKGMKKAVRKSRKEQI